MMPMSQMNPNMNQKMNMNQLAIMQQYNAMQAKGQRDGQQQFGGQSTIDKLFQQQGAPQEGVSLSELKQMPTNETQSHQQYLQQQMYEQSKKRQKTRKVIERKQPEKATDTELEEQRDKIRHLVKNINHGLDGYAPSKSTATEDTDSEKDSMEKEEPPKKQNIVTQNTESSGVLNMIKEVALLVFIYVILSQNFVRKTVGGYVSYINPRDDGSVSIIGYLIYGLILALIFVFLKNINMKALLYV